MKIRQSKDVCVSRFKDSAVLFDLRTYRACVLNKTAVLIWDLCKRLRRKEDLFKFISSKYKIGISLARRDTQRIINEFKKRKLIVVS